MEKRLKPREQGDLGELSAMEWLASQGARIAIPVFHSPDWDLIAEAGGRVFRVQVKTSCAGQPEGTTTCASRPPVEIRAGTG
jgi:Holliday junction resolvase-like predicted endonuclease